MAGNSSGIAKKALCVQLCSQASAEQMELLYSRQGKSALTMSVQERQLVYVSLEAYRNFTG